MDKYTIGFVMAVLCLACGADAGERTPELYCEHQLTAVLTRDLITATATLTNGTTTFALDGGQLEVKPLATGDTTATYGLATVGIVVLVLDAAAGSLRVAVNDTTMREGGCEP